MTDNEFGLVRANMRTGEILDASGKVVGRIVPVEPTDEHCAKAVCIARVWPMDVVNVPREFIDIIRMYNRAMLSAAPTDWSGVAVRVPESQPPTKHKDTQLDAAIHGWNSCLDAIKGAK